MEDEIDLYANNLFQVGKENILINIRVKGL